MTLRLLVLLLLLANGGYFAWTRGLLAGYGFAPTTQAEPQRMDQQIRPQAMRLLTPAEARQVESVSAAPTAAQPGTECLQAGLFNEQQTGVLRPLLESTLPPGSWALESSVEPARWILYMGKFANEEALGKKRGELRQLKVSFESVTNPTLSPGLSLGQFSQKADAEAELAKIATRGVRTARVVQERAEVRGQVLRVARVDSALKAQLESLKPQLEGKALQTCR